MENFKIKKERQLFDQQITKHHQIIDYAMSKLETYLNEIRAESNNTSIARQNFLNSCSEMKCDFAIDNLLEMLVLSKFINNIYLLDFGVLGLQGNKVDIFARCQQLMMLIGEAIYVQNAWYLADRMTGANVTEV